MSQAGAPQIIDLSALIAEHGIVAKKALGQNFLHERSVLIRIAEAAVGPEPGWVVEIGAGLGTLTAALVNAGAQVVAIEKDPRLADILEATFGSHPQVQIVCGDATTLRFAQLVPEGVRPAIAGNLPYSVSSPLLLAILGQRAETLRATVMLQREVANRLSAQPGTKAYGSLTVAFGLVADLTRVMDVGPGAFIPAPKVHSTVLQIGWRERPRADPGDRALFERLVRGAFGQRRKTLRNALFACGFPKELLEATAREVGIDLRRRGETLTVSEFAALSRALSAKGPDAGLMSSEVSDPQADP